MALKTTGVEIEGMEALRRAMEHVPEQATAIVSDIIAKTAFAASRRVISNAPRGATGQFRAGVTWKATGLNGRVLMQPSAYYWRFLEYGTKYIAARPIVRQAAEAEAVDFAKRITEGAERLERDFSTSRLV